MVSVIVPIYLNSPVIPRLLSECVASLVGYDELILQFDETGEGFSKTVNKGVMRSKGDYIAIVNDDTRMLEGSLKEYCKPNTICRPTIVGLNSKFPFAVMPRTVWDLIGGLDEDFKIGFYEDKLFLDIAAEKGVKSETLKLRVFHKGNVTISKMGDLKKLMAINWEIYKSKRKKL